MYNEPTNRNPNFVRLPLTEDQKAQVRATTGKEVDAIELTPQELEERIAPRMKLALE